jgi:excisionase family DNA binding protein
MILYSSAHPGDDAMELLTIQETARMLKVNPITIRRFIADGRLEAVRIGRGVRVRKAAVDQLAEPVAPKVARTKGARKTVRPMTWDDPMSKLVGSAIDAPPTDSSKKYEDLADGEADGDD